MKAWMRQRVTNAALILVMSFLCFPSRAEATQLTLGVLLTGHVLTSSTDLCYYGVDVGADRHLTVQVFKDTDWHGSL